MQFYKFTEVKNGLGDAIEHMMINVKKLKRVADIAHEASIVCRINSVVKLLEDVIEQSWNTLAEDPASLELYWDNDQPLFWM
jgi:hypothetical protein